MALNRSPEFKGSNPQPRAAELFGTCGHHLSYGNSEELNYAIHNTQFQASEPSSSETEDCFLFGYVFLQ